MNRYRARSIKEQGGLKVYLTQLGIDYDKFKSLKNTPGVTKKAMRYQLSADPNKPISAGAILNWWREDDQEMEESKHAEG